jgi:hypothetical protein
MSHKLRPSESRYAFYKIPNTPKGHALVEQMRLYLNNARYTLRVKGQGLSKGNSWRQYTRGQPIEKSDYLRVYVNENCD